VPEQARQVTSGRSGKHVTQTEGFRDPVRYVRSLDDLLRGGRTGYLCGQVLLPFSVLRRLDRVGGAS
jgi:hypothetical protein